MRFRASRSPASRRRRRFSARSASSSARGTETMSSACAADNVTSSPLRGLFVIESTHHALPDPSADLRVPSSESQFATSHLGHFQLTARLWEALSRTNAVEPDQRGRDASCGPSPFRSARRPWRTDTHARRHALRRGPEGRRAVVDLERAAARPQIPLVRMKRLTVRSAIQKTFFPNGPWLSQAAEVSPPLTVSRSEKPCLPAS